MDAEIVVPVTAMLSLLCYKVAKLIFHNAPSHRPHRTEDALVAAMEKRMAEMESRILTLQDIVIGADYEARRKLDQASAHLQTAHPADLHQSTASHSTPASQTAGVHHG